MDSEKEPTDGGRERSLPTAEPTGETGGYWIAFVRLLFELLGVERHARVQAEQRIRELEAQVEELRRELFGRKSEAKRPPDAKAPPEAPAADEAVADTVPPAEPRAKDPASGETAATPPEPPEPPKRRRGRQPGSRTPKRRKRPAARTRRERRELPADKRRCPQCGKPYRPNGFKISSLFEIVWEVVRREIVRVRYRPACQCPEAHPVVAPPEPRVMPGTQFGVSVWAEGLAQVFDSLRTQAGVARDWTLRGLDMPPSTLSAGLRRLREVFDPWIAALDARQAEATVLQADETSWRVQPIGSDAGPARHWLWVCLTADTVRFRVLPTRSSASAQQLLGATARDGPRIVVCDRWSAYKALAKACGGLLELAFCWAHQRRDFRRVQTGYPSLKEWAGSWLDAIGTLFWLAHRRREAWDADSPADRQSAAFGTLQGHLESVVQGLFDRARDELQAVEREAVGAAGYARAEVEARAKALRSLLTHEAGLRVFVQHPEVPPDNNASERAIRKPVIHRYTRFGSGSADGALLAEQMYSIYATLHEAGLNPYRWTQDYLAACARNGGQPPADLNPWLPWRMNAARRAELSRPVPGRSLAEPAPAEDADVSSALAA